MSDRFVVEADKHVIGIAVRVPGGFQFFSSDPDFQGLEGTVFPRARAIEQTAIRHSRKLASTIKRGRLQ